MVCSKCGAELKEGCIYCSRCGQEAQIVSEINLLEDDLLRQLMDEEEAAEKNTEGTAPSENLRPESDVEAERERRKMQEKRRRHEEEKRKKKIRMAVILIVILAAVAIAIFSVIHYQHNHSLNYLLGKAQTAYSQKNYVDAEDYLAQVLSLDADNQEALLLEGKISLEQNDYDMAEERFTMVISLDATCQDAYGGLISTYEAQGKTDEILALKKTVTDEEILALFADYIVAAPELSEESGSYSEYFTVEITAPEKKLTIYYTLDGTTPTSESELYEEPVEISEQGTTVLTAVCMNADGLYSDPVTAKYEVELDAPDAPAVSPDSGQFSLPTTVTITVPDGTTVYYTWDGTTPGTGSSRYTGPIEIPEGNNVLSVVAIDENGMTSSVKKYNYIYYPETSDTDTNADTGTENVSGDQ